MSGMILCRSEYSKVPYYIEGAAINVYSIEEICYFLYHDIYLVGPDFFCEQLFNFIEKNIKEPELAMRLRKMEKEGSSLTDKVVTILRYVDFYTENEIERLVRLIAKLDTQNIQVRKKARADNFLENKRYNSAINGYEDIVFDKYDVTLGEEFYGNVWHNMGTAYARLLMLDKASDCFRKGYEYNHNKKTREQYEIARQMMKAANDLEEIKYLDGSSSETAAKLQSALENVEKSPEYKAVKEILNYKNTGMVNEYYENISGHIAKWQEEYKRYNK